jgi:mannose-6-phosphate isomerase-like protein (cupin superfamily)
MKLVEIHKDKRGYTHTIEDTNLGCPEITLFYTKKGYARGGCVHRYTDEWFSVISGEVNLVYGDILVRMETGMTVGIPKGIPHYFVSKTDSVILEWGCSPEEKKEKNETFRNIVNQINDSADRT